MALLAATFSCSLSWASQLLRVRAQPEFTELRVQSSSATTRVAGSLVDERREPVTEAKVEIVGVESRPCVAGGELTDDAGQFCFQLELPPQRETLQLKFNGDSYLHAAHFELPLAAQPQSARLRFIPSHPRFELGRAPHDVRLELEATTREPTVYALRVALLRDGAGPRPVPGATSIARDNPVSVSIPSQWLTAPGPVRLLATATHPSGHVVAEESVAAAVVGSVELTWSEPLQPVRPTHGFTIPVTVTSNGQPLDTGWVELLMDDHSIGLAEVAAGQARISARFDAPRRRTVALEARYLPEQAWFRPGPPARASIELLGRSPWSHLPWIALGLVTLLWIARSWRRPLRQRAASARPARSATGRVSVVERAPSDSGWQGVVRDAHTGEPISDAVVTLNVPSLRASEPLRHATTLVDGRFRLTPLHPAPEGTRLVVQAPRYSVLNQPLPPAGSLSVEMVTRRRTLLEVFVRWAQQTATSRPRSGQPTPSQVAAVAERRGEAGVARWASDIERAAFGPTAPDAEQEAALIQATPPLDRPGKLER